MHRILSRTWEYAASANPAEIAIAGVFGLGALTYGAVALGVPGHVADLVRACVTYVAGVASLLG